MEKDEPIQGVEDNKTTSKKKEPTNKKKKN